MKFSKLTWLNLKCQKAIESKLLHCAYFRKNKKAFFIKIKRPVFWCRLYDVSRISSYDEINIPGAQIPSLDSYDFPTLRTGSQLKQPARHHKRVPHKRFIHKLRETGQHSPKTQFSESNRSNKNVGAVLCPDAQYIFHIRLLSCAREGNKRNPWKRDRGENFLRLWCIYWGRGALIIFSSPVLWGTCWETKKRPRAFH